MDATSFSQQRVSQDAYSAGDQGQPARTGKQFMLTLMES
jgi:hypothetical protein